MKYCRKFFATKEDAEQFKKEHGGVLYEKARKVKKGYGPNNYTVEASIAGMSEAQRAELPYCVAWNEKD